MSPFWPSLQIQHVNNKPQNLPEIQDSRKNSGKNVVIIRKIKEHVSPMSHSPTSLNFCAHFDHMAHSTIFSKSLGYFWQANRMGLEMIVEACLLFCVLQDISQAQAHHRLNKQWNTMAEYLWFWWTVHCISWHVRTMNLNSQSLLHEGWNPVLTCGVF